MSCRRRWSSDPCWPHLLSAVAGGDDGDGPVAAVAAVDSAAAAAAAVAAWPDGWDRDGGCPGEGNWR